TLYTVEIATSAAFQPEVSSAVISALTQTFSGLTPLTAYNLRVRAQNGIGVLSPAATLSTTTAQGTVPASAPALSASALGVSSISWTWSAVSPASGYNFFPSSGGPPIVLSSSTLSLVQTGLLINAP